MGTASAVIRGLLPTTVTAIGDNGNEYVLTGTWKSAGYNKDAAGTYYLSFKTEMPETLLDSYELLRVKVVLQKDEKKGCRSAVGGDGLILSAIFVLSALIKGKKKIKEEKHEN